MIKPPKIWIQERIKHQGSLPTLPAFYLYRFINFIVQIPCVYFQRNPVRLMTDKHYFYLSYDLHREDLIYKSLCPTAKEVSISNRLSIRDLLIIIILSLKNHIYFPNKIRTYLLGKKLLDMHQLTSDLQNKSYLAHDGTNFIQKMTFYWCSDRQVKTIRIIRRNTAVLNTNFDLTIYLDEIINNNVEQHKRRIELKFPLFIGNPKSLQLLGFEYKLFFYLLKRKLLQKDFYIRHHPQVPQWKIKICEFVFTKEKVLNNTVPIDNYDVRFLVQTYDSTISIMQNVSHVKSFKK